MRAVTVVGSKGKEVTVVERECSASDRLDTRREAEVSVVWGAGPLTVRRRRRGGEHPWALLVWFCLLVSGSCGWSCNAAADVAEQNVLLQLQNRRCRCCRTGVFYRQKQWPLRKLPRPPTTLYS